jgi:hypothetical protein
VNRYLKVHVVTDDGSNATFERYINPEHVKWVEADAGRCFLRLTEGEAMEVIGDPADVAKRLAIAGSEA